VATGVVVPETWPDDRFDVVWSFTLTSSAPPEYDFAELPQLLL
jgi:hypothetical protein